VKTDVLDPRLRRAAALLLAAVKLPAPMTACAEQMLEASKVLPGATVADIMLGDRRGGLLAARDLIDLVLAEEASA
jgi:hypothetical protein